MSGVSFAEDGALVCPSCGNGCLHQIRARVGFRRKDDEPMSLVVNVNGSGVSTEFATIAGRRDQIEILFSCERCAGMPELKITQHKGQTLIDWGL